MKHLVGLVMSLIFFESAQSKPAQFGKTEIVISGQKVIVDSATAFSNEKKFISGNLVLVSNFKNVPSDAIENLRKRRIQHFANFFVDDVEPYTHQKYLRSKCLILKGNDFVAFYAGDENNWSNCALANRSFLSKIKSVRLWKLCDTTLWEVTAVDVDKKELEIKCSPA